MSQNKLHRRKRPQKVEEREHDEVIDRNDLFQDSAELIDFNRDASHRQMEARDQSQVLEFQPLIKQQQTEKPPSKRAYLEKRNPDDGSSQQYDPSHSPQEDSNSLTPSSERLGSQTNRRLMAWIKKQERQLSNGDSRHRMMRQISKNMEIPYDTVRRRVDEHLRRRRPPPPEQRSQPQTIYRKTEMFDDAIKRVLKTTPYACINDLREEIENKLGLELAKETLIRRLKNLNYNYQKFSINKVEKDDDPNIIEQRRQYVRMQREVSAKKLPSFFYGICHLALDQCKGSMWMKNRESGELDHIVEQKDLVHIILILSRRRVEFYRIFRGFYSRKSYLAVMEQWLAQLTRTPEEQSKSARREARRTQQHFKSEEKTRPCYLMLEANLIHHQKCAIEDEVRDKMLVNGVMLLPLPMYSPSLNPAWLLFNHIKYYTRGKTRSRNVDDLIDNVANVLRNNVDAKDIDFAFEEVENQYAKY